MKKHILSLLLLVGISLGTNAQNDGILWKVSGNGLTKPSYLFGTIHYHCNAASFNKPVLVNAIKASSQVALEINLSDIKVLMAMFAKSMQPSGASLTQLLSPADYKIVDTTCRQYLDDSLANLDSKSPIDLLSTLYMAPSFTGCKGLPIDFLIVEMAKKTGKPIMGLETYAFQDSLLKSIPMATQATWLLDFCKENEKTKNDFMALQKAYDDQSCSELYRLTLETAPEFAYLKEALLDNRNQKWANFLLGHMKTESYFVAVGAGHLSGEKGLIKLLTQAGYTLTPMQI
jgi:uncharacterized protein YbaP (TraB family)